MMLGDPLVVCVAGCLWPNGALAEQVCERIFAKFTKNYDYCLPCQSSNYGH